MKLSKLAVAVQPSRCYVSVFICNFLIFFQFYRITIKHRRGMYKVVVSPSNRFAYKMGPNKESQNTANTIVLDDEDEDEPEEKNEPVDQPEIKRTIGNLKISIRKFLTNSVFEMVHMIFNEGGIWKRLDRVQK